MAGSSQGKESFSTDPFATFRDKNGSDSVVKGVTLGRGHVTGKSIVIITRRNKGNEEPIHDPVWKGKPRDFACSS